MPSKQIVSGSRASWNKTGRAQVNDLECQWWVGPVELPEARPTAAFEDWHMHIEECPVLPPVTSDELALFDALLSHLTD